MSDHKCYFVGRAHWRGGVQFEVGENIKDTSLISEDNLKLIEADEEIREVPMPKPKKSKANADTEAKD